MTAAQFEEFQTVLKAQIASLERTIEVAIEGATEKLARVHREEMSILGNALRLGIDRIEESNRASVELICRAISASCENRVGKVEIESLLRAR